jgi:plastocyanin
MNNRFVTISVFTIALALVACGGREAVEQAPAEEVIAVDMNDIYYGDANDNAVNPPVWQVGSGSEVAVRMENMGALEHNWAVLKAGEDVPVPFDENEHGDKILFSAGIIAGGVSNEVSFTAPEPGEYNVVCTVPGHAAAMKGQLIVEG